MPMDFSWQDGERVLFLGDIVTEDPLGFTRLLPAMVSARYPERNIEYLLRGAGGNRIGDVAARLPHDLLELIPPPSWIGVSIGLNDVWDGSTGTPLGRFIELYHELLTRLQDTNASIACMTTTVRGEDLDNDLNKTLVGYNEAIAAVAFEHGAQVVHVNLVFQEAIRRAQERNPDFRYTIDGVRLNVYGNYLLTETLLQALHFALPVLPT